MFYVELKSKNNNKDMYEVGSLLDCRVKFETSYPKREIPESALTARGRYGDTKSFCFRRASCVKCAGDHPTINCPRREKSKLNVLCEGNYSANYKGCMVYKDLRRNVFPTLQRKVVIWTTITNWTCKYTNQTCPTRKIICFSRKNW